KTVSTGSGGAPPGGDWVRGGPSALLRPLHSTLGPRWRQPGQGLSPRSRRATPSLLRFSLFGSFLLGPPLFKRCRQLFLFGLRRPAGLNARLFRRCFGDFFRRQKPHFSLQRRKIVVRRMLSLELRKLRRENIARKLLGKLPLRFGLGFD